MKTMNMDVAYFFVTITTASDVAVVAVIADAADVAIVVPIARIADATAQWSADDGFAPIAEWI